MRSKTAVPHPLPDELAELIAARFRVLAEPTRIRLLDRLRERDMSVGELAAELETTQQNASKHLGILHQAGIVSRRKQGNSTVYAIADPAVFELCEQICGGLREQLDELGQLLGGATS